MTKFNCLLENYSFFAQIMQLKVNSMSVVLVSPNNRLNSSSFLDTVSRLKNVKTKCFHSDIVNVEDVSTLSDVTKRMFDAFDLHVVVLIGVYKDQHKFMFQRYL